MIEQNQTLRAKAASGGRWTAIGAMVTIALQLAQLAILGRTLGPSEFGLMAMMMVVIGLTNSVADFGFGNYLVQKETLSRRTLVHLLLMVGGVAALLAISITLSSPLIARYYKQPFLVQLLPWMSLSVVAFAISQILMSTLQRFFAFKKIVIGETFSGCILLVTTAYLAITGYGVWSLVIGQLVAGTTRAIVFAVLVLDPARLLPKHDQSELSTVKTFAAYQTGERLLNYLGWNLDKLIIGRILGEVALGFYSVAYQLMIRPLSVLNPIFTRVALPLFVNIRNDDARLAAGYLDTVKIIALVSFPIYIAMALCAPAIIQIIMGEKWGEAAPILYFLSLLGLFFSIGNPIGTLILAKGKPKWAFQLNCFSLLIYAFAFWLGSQYSALAVAVAFLVAGVFVLFPVEFYLRHQLVGMTLVQYFSAMRHLFIAAAIPILLHAFFYLSDMSSSNIDSQLISAFFAVIFFFTYLLFKDRQLIVIAKNLVLKDHL